MLRDSAAVLIVGWAVFMLCGLLSELLVHGPAEHQIALKSLLALASLALIAAWRSRVPGTYGLQLSSGVPWRRVVLTGLTLGATASFLILLMGGSGMRAAFGAMKFWQIL